IQRRVTTCGGRRKTQPTVRDGLTTTDRLIRAGVQLEKSDSGRNALRQLKAAYRTRKSRSTEDRSSTGDINPAKQKSPSQSKNHKALTKLFDEILKNEGSLREKSKTLENQKKELKDKILKSQRVTQKALKKSKKAEQKLRILQEKYPNNSEIEKAALNNGEIKELLIDILNTLDPPPTRTRTTRESDITRHSNRQRLKTKTQETQETQETQNKKHKPTPIKALEIISEINKRFTK
ncbi:hypothetical protein, partial [Pseudomonas aeruginosa]